MTVCLVFKNSSKSDNVASEMVFVLSVKTSNCRELTTGELKIFANSTANCVFPEPGAPTMAIICGSEGDKGFILRNYSRFLTNKKDSLSSENLGRSGGTRTPDTWFWRPVL
jgi:hypothetical protein